MTCTWGAGHWYEFTVHHGSYRKDNQGLGFLGSSQRSSGWPWFETTLPWTQLPSHLKHCHSAEGIFKGHFVVCLQWCVKLSSCLWLNKMLHRLYDESMQLNKLLQREESHDFPVGCHRRQKPEQGAARWEDCPVRRSSGDIKGCESLVAKRWGFWRMWKAFELLRKEQ